MIYMSLIFSHISYCNLIWGSAKKTIIEPLFKLQKKVLRLVNNSQYLDNSDPFFNFLKTLAVHKVFKLNCLVFIYRCLKKDKFTDFRDRFIKNSCFTHTALVLAIYIEYLMKGSMFAEILTLCKVLLYGIY